MKEFRTESPGGPRKPCMPIVGGLILFTVVLGTTDLGFVPVPTEIKYATTMHLPTILASLLEGWPVGMVVGAVVGITSMYTPGTPMASDPMVALFPRIFIGLTPILVYRLMTGYSEHLRVGCSAIVGTFTNTIGFLGMTVVMGYMQPSVAFSIALKHGIPEAVIAVIVVVPSLRLLRLLELRLSKYHH